MPIQSVSTIASSASAEFFAAARSRMTSRLAAQGDAILQNTKNTPEVHAPVVGVSRTPIKFSGAIVDLKS